MEAHDQNVRDATVKTGECRVCGATVTLMRLRVRASGYVTLRGYKVGTWPGRQVSTLCLAHFRDHRAEEPTALSRETFAVCCSENVLGARTLKRRIKRACAQAHLDEVRKAGRHDWAIEEGKRLVFAEFCKNHPWVLAAAKTVASCALVGGLAYAMRRPAA